MTDIRFVKSYSDIEVTDEQRERIWEQLMQDAEDLGMDSVMPVVQKPRRHKKLWRTVLVAAVISSLLGVTAYASDFLGMRGMFISGSRGYQFEEQTDGSNLAVEVSEGGLVSLTQPQTLPESIDPAIKQKVDNSAAAWAEWDSWREVNGVHPPKVFEMPEGTTMIEETENQDGTYTVQFYKADGKDEQTGELNHTLLEERIATAEENARWEEYLELMGKGTIPGYTYGYGVLTVEMGAKLDEIAAKYGLALRRKETVLYQKSENFDFEGCYPLAAIVEILSDNGCSGPFFNRNPDIIDHAYYYDEGTFAIDYGVYAPSDGEKLLCYGYNSPYGTLSSGNEVVSMESDLTKFVSRTHMTPDGTELTIMSDGMTAYFYVYLKDSYYAQSIRSFDGLTDADVDYIADAINYSSIGK